MFTVDGDWLEYFYPSLPEEKREPKKERLLSWIGHEISIASSLIGGKFIHFVHTSPRARDFFLQPAFISQWKEIEKKGGDIGVHPHEDDPWRAYYFDNERKMRKSIGLLTKGLRRKSVNPMAYRGGYMAFNRKIIPILEKNKIFLDFSCDPGRYLLHGNLLVSDWRGAPRNFYRMSYGDHRRAGRSRVFEIPLGIYIETSSLRDIWKKAKALKKRKGKIVVSVMAHSYDFGSFLRRLKIKLALLILRRYGSFVNAREALELVR